MTPAVAQDADRARALRDRLRPPSGALAAAPIGAVPILWNNVDLADLRHGTDASTILDEIARIGYDGCQLGIGFPEGAELRDALAERNLRLAEVYASLPTSAEGPSDGALEHGLERLRLLVAGDGDVLTVALDLSPGRAEAAGRTDVAGTPRLTAAGWDRLVDHLHELARATAAAGRRLAFHPHAGTFVESPAETDVLLRATDPTLVGLCLDVGHWIVGGGDPVAALGQYATRVAHVHLKDVDPLVVDRLRAGELADFRAAVRARIFTELGSGTLDLIGCLRILAADAYGGWLMVEQDSSWSPPSEAAAVGRRVLAHALAIVGREEEAA